MKYRAHNDLSLFEFHDSIFTLVSFDGKDLLVSASRVNIHKNTPQNPSDYDMQIASAQIIFKNLHSLTYEPGVAFRTGEDGQLHPEGPSVVLRGQEAIDRILKELRYRVVVYHFEKEDQGYSLGGQGVEPYFEMKFDFDSVDVCWEEYTKKAWYELHRQYQYDAVLHTPYGDTTVKLTVGCHEEPVYCDGSLQQPPTVNVSCTFEGKEYGGHGSDALWIDAFADLQRKLPEGVFLKGCLSCRYGNLCPVGNGVNEVFCTKDVLIRQKSDLYFYTEDATERSKRSRQYWDFCEDYQPQTEECYTYNDYWYYLQKQ